MIYDFKDERFVSDFIKQASFACDSMGAVYNKRFLMNDGIENAIAKLTNSDANFIFRFIVNKLDVWRQTIGCYSEFFINLMRFIYNNFSNCTTEKFANELESIRVSFLNESNPRKPEINELIQDLGCQEDFYRQICKHCYDDVNVNIFSSFENSYVKYSPYFDFSCEVFSSKKQIKNCNVIFINDVLSAETVFGIHDMGKECVIFCNIIDDENEDIIKKVCNAKDSFIHIVRLNNSCFFENAMDLMNIFDCKELYDSRFSIIGDYKFGTIKELVYEAKKARVSGIKKYDLRSEDSFKENRAKFLMLNGKNVDINVSLNDGFYLASELDFVYELANKCKTIFKHGVVGSTNEVVERLVSLSKSKIMKRCFYFVGSNMPNFKNIPIEVIDRSLRFAYFNIKEINKVSHYVRKNNNDLQNS